MSVVAIADTGFLYAALDASDEHHGWAVEQFRRYPYFYTCEAVICEVTHLAGSRLGRPNDVFELIEAQALKVGFSLLEQEARVARLMQRYADRPMDFADACLVVMSEVAKRCEVVTVDGDFRFYRRFGKETIPVSMP